MNTAICPLVKSALRLRNYQSRIKKTSDNSIAQDWTTKVSGGAFTGLSLSDDTNYYFELRSIDNANNASSIVTTANFKTNLALFTSIAVGGSYSCGLSTIGSVKCWGNVPYYGSYQIPTTLSGLETGVTQISSGAFSACVVQSGSGKCFGMAIFGDQSAVYYPLIPVSHEV